MRLCDLCVGFFARYVFRMHSLVLYVCSQVISSTKRRSRSSWLRLCRVKLEMKYSISMARKETRDSCCITGVCWYCSIENVWKPWFMHCWIYVQYMAIGFVQLLLGFRTGINWFLIFHKINVLLHKSWRHGRHVCSKNLACQQNMLSHKSFLRCRFLHFVAKCQHCETVWQHLCVHAALRSKIIRKMRFSSKRPFPSSQSTRWNGKSHRRTYVM